MTSHATRTLASLLLFSVAMLDGGTASRATVPRFQEVAPGIFRSAQPSTEDLRAARERGIRTLLVVRETIPKVERHEAARLGLKLVNVPMLGERMPTVEEVDRALDVMMDPSKLPVLVHCRHGEDRTGVVIAAYRIVVNGWEPAAAEAEARKFRFSFGDLGEFLARYTAHRRQMKPPGGRSAHNSALQP